MLSVLLLPGGGGEDDIDIGGGVLVLGGVLGPGHGGGVVVRGGSGWSSLAFVPTCHQHQFYTLLCKSKYESSNPE